MHNDEQEQTDEILEEYDKPYDEGMEIFANHSDCDGEITSDECVFFFFFKIFWKGWYR